MDKVFGKYAQYYDILYADKDYEKECDFIEEAFRRYSSFKPLKILDAGCGTGGHLIPLTKRGYHIVGIDASESMIAIAKRKVRRLGLNSELHVMDIRNINLDKVFDACICMFAVISYLTTNSDITKAFTGIHRHLKPGGILVFDLWYGPAVLILKPSVRVKVVEKDGLKVLRTVTPELDTLNCLCKSNYYLTILKGENLIDEVTEVHTLRFLFPQELKHYLEEGGFELLKLCEFLKLDHLASENTWNAAAIAKRI